MTILKDINVNDMLPPDLRSQFPIYKTHSDLIYLDTAATALTPQSVIDKITEYYTTYNANTSRGVYALSERATQEMEATRTAAASFFGAMPEEIIFTSGTTHALNMIAFWHTHTMTAQHNIVTTTTAHHANLLPWQRLAKDTAAELRFMPLTPDGHIDRTHLTDVLDKSTALVSFAAVGNVLGTTEPLTELVAAIRTQAPHAKIVIDAAQAAPHMEIDITEIDCDYLVASTHKMYGPTGVGLLYGKKEFLEDHEPFLLGGEMIAQVTATAATYCSAPHRHEAGTLNIANIIGMQSALAFIDACGRNALHEHTTTLAQQARAALAEHFETAITFYGSEAPEAGIVTFTMAHAHPHDIAQIVDASGVALRAGQHCTAPLHNDVLQIPATCRISFGAYNTVDDISALIRALDKALSTLTPRA